MSCRSTAFTSALTSFARFNYPNLSDSQIQSLFHGLKRTAPNDTFTKEEYLSFINSQITAVRNSDLSERNKESLIQRLDDSTVRLDGLTPDNVYAAKSILAEAAIADAALDSVSAKVGNTLGRSAEFVRFKLTRWREASDDAFEDVGNFPGEFRYDLTPGAPQDEATLRALRKLGYEHFLTQPYPVFVYGTLRRGQGNFPIFGGHYYDVEGGEVSGISIYGAERAFPYAKENEENSNAFVKGDIIWVDQTSFGAEVRYSLDSLEGFSSDFPSDSHYERKLKVATFKDQSGNQVEQLVWIYVASGRYRNQLSKQDIIENGDWVEARVKYLNSPLGRKDRRFYYSE